MYPESYEPPNELTERAAALWRRMVPVLDRRGHWLPAECTSFEFLCAAWDDYVDCLETMAEDIAEGDWEAALIGGEVADDMVSQLRRDFQDWALSLGDVGLVAGTSDPSRPEYLAAQRVLRGPVPAWLEEHQD